MKFLILFILLISNVYGISQETISIVPELKKIEGFWYVISTDYFNHRQCQTFNITISNLDVHFENHYKYNNNYYLHKSPIFYHNNHSFTINNKQFIYRENNLFEEFLLFNKSNHVYIVSKNPNILDNPKLELKLLFFIRVLEYDVNSFFFVNQKHIIC